MTFISYHPANMKVFITLVLSTFTVLIAGFCWMCLINANQEDLVEVISLAAPIGGVAIYFCIWLIIQVWKKD